MQPWQSSISANRKKTTELFSRVSRTILERLRSERARLSDHINLRHNPREPDFGGLTGILSRGIKRMEYVTVLLRFSTGVSEFAVLSFNLYRKTVRT